MGLEDIGEAWNRALANPIAACRRERAALPGSGDQGRELERRGLAICRCRCRRRVRFRAVSDGDALHHARSRQRHPEHGHVSRGAESQRPAGGAHGGARRRRGGYVHWLKYNKRKQPMPIAIVLGCGADRVFTGAQKLAWIWTRRRWPAACRRADPHGDAR
jgi:hypothetical protein